MIRKIFAIAALAFSGLAFAGTASVDVSGLTEAQVAELKAIAAKKVADAAAAAHNQAPAATPENITAGVALAATWGGQASEAAKGFAQALGIAARELNITINDFLRSPAGILTAVLVVWKIAGASVLKLLFGSIFTCAGLLVARALWKRLFTDRYETVTYSWFGGVFTGSKVVRIPKPINSLRQDGEWLALWMVIGIVGLSFILGGIIMF